METAVAHGLDHGALNAVEPPQQRLRPPLLKERTAIEPPGLLGVEHAVLQKAHHARHVDLAALRGEKLLQLVVAERGVFDVNLAHDPDLHPRNARHGDGGEILDDEREGLLEIAGLVPAPGRDAGADALDPAIHQPVRRAGDVLIRGDLVAQRHEHIGIEDAADQLANQRKRELKAAVLFQTRKVQRGHRNLGVTGLHQRLAQQMDVVGGPAAAARLGDEQRGVIHVVAPGLQGVDKLPDHQQRGVAGVVVDVFQPQLGHLAAAVFKHLDVIALLAEQLGEKTEMQRQHTRNENGVRALHGRCEFRVSARVKIRHERSPSRAFRPARQVNCGCGCSPRRGS